ncbi:hypothetical protein KI387_012326, partial [Taxus chinensis]
LWTFQSLTETGKLESNCGHFEDLENTMVQRDMNLEEEQFLLCKQSGKKSQVLPDSTKEGLSASSVSEIKLAEQLLLDPQLLYIGSKIGEGAHGKVYQGKYRDESVAIKILHTGETLEEKAKLEARFAREVAMMSRVQHKNLVKFIGACKDPFMVIVTELLPGMSLRKYMMNLRPNRMDLHVAISFALDIAQAMDCLHANGIIHRDLKPDNLLLTEDQKSVKLIDFGLAREESVTEMMTAETGTYRWMAPELYSTVTLRHGEKKHYNLKVDVYSFSIVLWELISNRMPFEGMSHLQAAYAAAFKQARPDLPEGLHEDLAFILQSCWAEDPNIRPNFGQIIRLLNTFLCTLPGHPRPVLETIKSSDSLKESPNLRLVRGNASDDGSIGAAARAKRRFSCFGQCFSFGRRGT